MVNKNKIADEKNTLPEYIDDSGKEIFANKEWKKDPLLENVTIDQDHINLYLLFIINKNYAQWKSQIEADQWEQFEHDFLPDLLSRHINGGENSIFEQITNFLRQPNNYQNQVENFQTQYKEDAKLKLRPSKLRKLDIIPKQARQSVIFKTKIKSLIYHFNNIRLGDFAFAIFDKYIKISPHYTFDKLDINKTDEYILLSDNTIKFYISQCDNGLLVEFNFNYYTEIIPDNQPKCNFIDRPKNIIDKDKILKKIGQILQIKKYESLKEDYTQASFQVECQNINKSVWAYLAMNDDTFSKYITIPESRISKKNNRFFFKFSKKIQVDLSCKSYLELENKKGNFGQITAKYTNIKENLIEIFVSRSLGEKSIFKFQKNLLSLLDYYVANVDRIIKLYKNYNIPLLQKVKVKKSPAKNNLKNLYKGYFNTGYSTNCSKYNQPAVVSQKEMEIEIKKGLHLDYILKSPQSKKDAELIKKGKYPLLTPYTNSQGFESLYFLCNKKNSQGYIPSKKKKNFYPRLNKNGCPCCMSNKKISQQSKSKGTTSDECGKGSLQSVSSGSGSYKIGNALCSGVCALPPLLKNIFFILDPKHAYHRQSATQNILVLLNAIFKKNITKSNISKYKFLGIAKQENWDIDNIKEYINEQKCIDPARFIRILEEIYDCKLFILHRKKQVSRDTLDSREVPTLLTPRYNHYTNYYSWNKSNKRVVILFSHFGTKANIISEPYYELVTQTEWEEKNPHIYMFNSKQDIVVSLYKFENMVNESYCLNKELEPFNPINFENAIQIIDYYGKCRGIIIDELPLLFDPIPPLNLPYEKLKDVKYDTRKKVFAKCEKLGIKITHKKNASLLKGKYKDIIVRIPIKVDNDNKFDETRINAKYIVAWTFYLFSKYWSTHSPDIDKFLKKHIKVKSKMLTKFHNIIFNKDVKSLHVPNEECIRNLRFVLTRKYHTNQKLLKDYHHHNIIPDFFNEIRDFKSYSNEIILYIDNVAEDLDTNFFTRFSDVKLDTMMPYFVSKDNELWIYQNCQTEEIKKSIKKTWRKHKFNNVAIIQPSSTKFLAKLKI